MIWLCGVAAAFVAGGVTAGAQEREHHSDKARDVLAGFEYTGNTERCLTPHRIDDVDVLDDWTLLFEMSGDKYYVSHLSHRCPSLAAEERFTYTLRGINQLCDNDIITVLHSDLTEGASCGLETFEELKKTDD